MNYPSIEQTLSPAGFDKLSHHAGERVSGVRICSVPGYFMVTFFTESSTLLHKKTRPYGPGQAADKPLF